MKIEMDLINLQAAKVKENSLGAESRGNVNFGANDVSMPEVQKLSGARITKIRAPKINSITPLAFTGGTGKNLNQIVSIAPEYQGLMDEMYKLGGLGNVAGEAAPAFKTHGKADIRTFVPYHAFNNKEGNIKVMVPVIEEDGTRKIWTKDEMNETLVKKGLKPNFKEDMEAFTLKSVPQNYDLQEGEKFVIHLDEVGREPYETHPKILEDTGIKGDVEVINENLELEKVHYRMLKVAPEINPKTGEVIPKPDVYVMHLPGTSAFAKSYNSGANTNKKGAYSSGDFEDLQYGVFNRAVVDALPRMNNDQFGNFNPASFWMHDRQAFISLVPITEKSAQNADEGYWNGIRAHATFHNPGRDYQGHYRSPFDFLKIVGTKETLKLVKQHVDFPFISEMSQKIESAKEELKNRSNSAQLSEEELKKYEFENILTPEELERLDQAFEPLFGKYRDEFGEYNLCKLPLVGTKENPENLSGGTVSKYFGKEMKSSETPEITYGLTSAFKDTETIDIVNGSTPGNMRLFEKGGLGAENGLSTKLDGFNPYPQLVKDEKGIVQNIDEVYKVKQANKKWFINTVAQATKEGNDALVKLFYNKDQIEKSKMTVLGGLSEFKEGDQLFISWGRSDKQKGFPTTMESFHQFFTDPDVPEELKLRTKVLFSAGPWPEDATKPEHKEWKIIQETLEKIQKHEDGKYANNIVYLNGFFSNRIGMFSDWAIITSEFEPCGITPLEAFASGTPVLSNRTGGSPDFITEYDGTNEEKATGFMTEHAYKAKPEVLGGKAGITGDELETLRRTALGGENALNIKKAMELSTSEPEKYKKMSRNAISLKIDWHENKDFNDGTAAQDRYFGEAWHITADGNGNFSSVAGKERSQEPMTPAVGTKKETAETVLTAIGAAGGIGALIAAIGRGGNSAKKADVKAATAGIGELKTQIDGLKTQVEDLTKLTKKHITDSKKGGLSRFLSTRNGKIAAAVTAVVVLGAGAAAIAYSRSKKPKGDNMMTSDASYIPQAPPTAPASPAVYVPNITPVVPVVPAPVVAPAPPVSVNVSPTISDYFVKSA